ncbi:hypothetical protein [Streptomyces humidus]|uniref:hypothetical protein n=1 Tax=Streptomyces humidus TaxID=52259 RepID=UPI003326FA4B
MTSQLPSPISASRLTCPGDDLSRTFEMRFTSTPRGVDLTASNAPLYRQVMRAFRAVGRASSHDRV